MPIPVQWDELGATWDQTGATWDAIPLPPGASLAGGLVATASLQGALLAGGANMAGGLVATAHLLGSVRIGVRFAGSLVATGVLAGPLIIPSFPSRTRFRFYWPQPIGPTHVRIF